MRAPALFLAGLLLLLPTCGVAPAGADQGGQEEHAIPVRNADGSSWTLQGRICRPPNPGPSRLVVVAHGSPAVAARRPEMQLTRCDSEAARWFLGRGYVVAFALRRGYGATGGTYWENSRPCATADFLRAARESARDLRAVIDYATALPFVRPDGVIVVGQSAGGWAALGLDSEPHPRVVALVSVAGGRGGHADGNQPNTNCHPENLAAAAGVLGQSSTTPMLWIFTENDSFFAPPIARAMHSAFTASGGKAELRQLPPYRTDGHSLFFGPGGSGIWGPIIEAYLRQQRAL